MKKYLLDTNVISELGKQEPNQSLVSFVSSLDRAWLSTITIHEIEYGLNLLPEGNRRSQLEESIVTLMSQYAAFIIPVNHEEAEAAAVLRATARKAGKTAHLADSLIAGTAKVHGLTVVTRNIKDFEILEVDVENPWSSFEVDN